MYASDQQCRNILNTKPHTYYNTICCYVSIIQYQIEQRYAEYVQQIYARFQLLLTTNQKFVQREFKQPLASMEVNFCRELLNPDFLYVCRYFNVNMRDCYNHCHIFIYTFTFFLFSSTLYSIKKKKNYSTEFFILII